MNSPEGHLTLHFRHAFQPRLPKIMKKIEKSTTTNSLFVDFLKFYLWLFVAFSTKIPQIKWPVYLASNSRPDISFAVHQCARFTHTPKALHGEAILRICRYLKGTGGTRKFYSTLKLT